MASNLASPRKSVLSPTSTSTPSRKSMSMSVTTPLKLRSPSVRKGSGTPQNFTLRRELIRKQEIRAYTLELSAWLAATLNTDDFRDKLLDCDAVQSGRLLGELLERIRGSFGSRPFNKMAKPNSFIARDNINTFIEAALDYGVPRSALVEVEDFVSKRNPRSVLLFLMELAKQAYEKEGIPPPGLIRAELAVDHLRKTVDEYSLAVCASHAPPVDSSQQDASVLSPRGQPSQAEGDSNSTGSSAEQPEKDKKETRATTDEVDDDQKEKEKTFRDAESSTENSVVSDLWVADYCRKTKVQELKD